MKTLIKKYSRLAAAGVIAASMFSIANFAFATDNNYTYSFTLKPYYENSYTDSLYRGTTNPGNEWKVNLAYSSEGYHTKATFWLDKSGTRVSSVETIEQGSGAHYYSASSSANQSWVRLGAENNNYTANSYTVSGYWDEETGKTN